jgi:hypothetical protein
MMPMLILLFLWFDWSSDIFFYPIKNSLTCHLFWKTTKDLLVRRSMTKNTDGDSVCSRVGRLITEFEQSKDPDSTEIGRQFAVRD